MSSKKQYHYFVSYETKTIQGYSNIVLSKKIKDIKDLIEVSEIIQRDIQSESKVIIINWRRYDE